MKSELIIGDALHISVAANTFHIVIASPPYLGQRDYDTAHWDGGDPACDHVMKRKKDKESGLRNDGREHKGLYDQEKALDILIRYPDICAKCGAKRIDKQIGKETSPELYVSNLVTAFREVQRVMRPDATFWLNLGDCYTGSGKNYGMKSKDLMGMPWRVAFALQGLALIRIDELAQLCKAIDSRDLPALDWFRAGFQLWEELAGMNWFWLRNDVIWAKNTLPESVTDRLTKSYEHVFLLTKSPHYFFDYVAIMEPAAYDGRKATMMKGSAKYKNGFVPNTSPQSMAVRGHERWQVDKDGQRLRQKRDVWYVPTASYKGAHFATFPERLVTPMILAGTSRKGCCPACGAPWKRIIEKETHFESGSGRAGRSPEEVGGKWGENRYEKNILLGPTNSIHTVGWEAGCSCNAGEPVPCKVLDPFNGAGTTGLVALQLGCDYLGIDLSPEYLQQTRKRLQGTQISLFAV